MLMAVSVGDFGTRVLEQTGLSTVVQERVAISLFAVVLIWLVRLLLVRAFDARIEDDNKVYAWRRGVTWVSYLVVLLILLRIWIDGLTGFATFFGLVAAGVAIALAAPLQSMAAWLYILIYRPFTIGDRIVIGEQMGDVVDIRLFSTVIYELGDWVGHEQSTGRIIHIPNKFVLEDTVLNASRGLGLLWNEIEVLLTFESNWKLAKTILIEILSKEVEEKQVEAAKKARKAKREMKVQVGSLEPTIFTSTRDSGVLLTMRYLCDVDERRMSEHRVWEQVLTAFAAEDDIDFAYPTQRAYLNMYEGKQSLQKEGLTGAKRGPL